MPVFAQFDTLTPKFKRHEIYISPTSHVGEEAIYRFNIWLNGGYQYRLNERHTIGAEFGGIIYSNERYRGVFFKQALNTKGYYIHLEHKILIKKGFFYGTTVYYRTADIDRPHKKYPNEENYFTDLYTVHRQVFGIIPRIGFYYEHKHFFQEVALGVGVRFVNSTNNCGEPCNSPHYDDKELLVAKKRIDEGSSLAQRITFQWKIGVRF